MSSVRAKLQKLAEMYDDEGYGGVLLGAGDDSDDDYGGVLLGAAVTKSKKRKGGVGVGAGLSQYSEFVKKYRKGNQFSMAEIAQMWKEKKAKGGVMIGGVNVGGRKPKKVASGSKTMKKSISKPKGNIAKCLKNLKIAKENDIKLTAAEKAKLFKNHGCSYAKYKKLKGKTNKPMNKAALKKKLLSKPKKK
jgi:hypothetical protein